MEVATNPPSQFGDEQLSLILFEASVVSTAALQRALRRIRRTLRGTDILLAHEHMCAIVLPATPMAGAQVVAQRLSAQLVDVEYSTQLLYGATAQAALRRLHALRAIEIRVEIASVEDTDGCTPHVPVPAHVDGGTREAMVTQPATTPARQRKKHTQRKRATLAALATTSTQEGTLVAKHASASLPHLAFLTSYPPLRLFQSFPYALARQYQCVPVGIERGVLTLATCQLLEPAVVAHLQEVTQRAIFQVSCELSLIEDVLRYWERSLPTTVSVS